jgi:hypothetical protein
MENRIQQEIDKTLACMADGLDVSVNPLFWEGLNRRMANVHVSRGPGYRTRVSYPLVIVLLMVMNLATCLVSVKARQPVSETVASPESVLASEYGLGQDDPMSF